MTSSKQTQLVLLAAGLLILAVLSMAWWLTSPQGVRRAGEAILLIVGAACAITHCRRMPSASPAVLYTTVIGAVVVIARPGGPLFPIILAAVVALAWAAISLGQSSAVRDRMSLRETDLDPGTSASAADQHAVPQILTTVSLRTYGPALRSGDLGDAA